MLLLAKNRPSWVSSWQEGAGNLNANDGDTSTNWLPAIDDSKPWWRLDLEAAYNINGIRVDLPDDKYAHYIIEVTADGSNWHTVAECARKGKKQHFQCVEYGVSGVRISFFPDSEQFGLAEVMIGGVPASSNLR